MINFISGLTLFTGPINRLSDNEKIFRIEKFEKIGYEYNDKIHLLLELETNIPYDFIVYCLMVEDMQQINNTKKGDNNV